jgi:hypothetical protein
MLQLIWLHGDRSNSKFWLIVFGEPYAGGVTPQTPIGGRYAALQTSHVGVDFAELPRCLY